PAGPHFKPPKTVPIKKPVADPQPARYSLFRWNKKKGGRKEEDYLFFTRLGLLYPFYIYDKHILYKCNQIVYICALKAPKLSAMALCDIVAASAALNGFCGVSPRPFSAFRSISP
ncbi:MAG: hypothetical protein KC476_10285, partial [Cyanobacteria bacterium HKST-UBA06]|nr:hypothetical protein [Cyanobacteria bacterium HKST-UBA06]